MLFFDHAMYIDLELNGFGEGQVLQEWRDRACPRRYGFDTRHMVNAPVDRTTRPEIWTDISALANPTSWPASFAEEIQYAVQDNSGIERGGEEVAGHP